MIKEVVTHDGWCLEMLALGRPDAQMHTPAGLFPYTSFLAPSRFACPCGAHTAWMSPTPRAGARSAVPQQLQYAAMAGGSNSTYATSDLLLQYPDETLATYVRNN